MATSTAIRGEQLVDGGGAADDSLIYSGGLVEAQSDGAVDAPVIDGGTLQLDSGAIVGSGGVAFAADASYGVLDLSGEGAGSAFASNFTAVVSGFAGLSGTSATSDVIDVDGSGQVGDHVVWTQSGGSGTLQVEDVNDDVLAQLTLAGAYNQDQFVLTDPAQVDQIAYAMPCYARGTRILTDRGDVAVEALRIGDLAVTVSGASRPIIWIGHRKVDLSRHIRPQRVNPVRIAAGALAQNVPARDLLVSPEHGLWLDGALVCAGDLINGATIRQGAWREVEYFHVELESHDVVLAEGAPAESYLDCGNRGSFDNGGDALALHPEWRPSEDSRRFASPSQVARTRARLTQRAVALGRAAELAAFSAYEQARAKAPRQNWVRNPRGEGAVRGRIGEGGAAPAFWWCAAPSGVAVEIAGSGLEAALPYVDIRFVGCAQASGHCAIYPAPGTAIAAERGQDWTFSAYLRRVGGGYEGVRALGLYFDEYGANGCYLDGEPRALRLPSGDALALQRVCATHRIRNDRTRSMTGYVQARVAVGAAVDLSLRVGGFQIERGDYASGLLLPAEGAFGPVLREVGDRQVTKAASLRGGRIRSRLTA
jgi:hypothetical protein